MCSSVIRDCRACVGGDCLLMSLKANVFYGEFLSRCVVGREVHYVYGIIDVFITILWESGYEVFNRFVEDEH